MAADEPLAAADHSSSSEELITLRFLLWFDDMFVVCFLWRCISGFFISRCDGCPFHVVLVGIQKPSRLCACGGLLFKKFKLDMFLSFELEQVRWWFWLYGTNLFLDISLRSGYVSWQLGGFRLIG